MDNPLSNEVRPAVTPEAPSWPPHEAEPVAEQGHPADQILEPTITVAEPAPATEILVAPATSPQKSELDKEIEGVLQEDLDELFWNLKPEEQAAFKKKGEETAAGVRTLLGEATVRIQEIFQLILDWLKTLPGVNSFFAEKEAKIKTDKILRFRQ